VYESTEYFDFTPVFQTPASRSSNVIYEPYTDYLNMLPPDAYVDNIAVCFDFTNGQEVRLKDVYHEVDYFCDFTSSASEPLTDGQDYSDNPDYLCF